MTTYTHDELLRQLRAIRAHRDSRYCIDTLERREMTFLLRVFANRILWSGINA